MMVDLLRYWPAAPAGVPDFLLVELMAWARGEGVQWFNLGLTPANPGIESTSPDGPHPPEFPAALCQPVGTETHGRQFKQQFDPIWIPKFLVSPGGVAPTRVLANLSALVEHNPLGRKGNGSRGT